jgi:hypothetical protein
MDWMIPMGIPEISLIRRSMVTPGVDINKLLSLSDLQMG